MAMPPPHVVGHAFAVHYYSILNVSPEKAHEFYHDGSILRRPNFIGGMTSITTTRAIKRYYLSTEFRGCSMELEDVDTQTSYEGGLLVLAAGSFFMPGTAKRRFTQSFFLAPQETGGYFVLNDALIYVLAEPETPDVTESLDAQQTFHQDYDEDDSVENGCGDNEPGEMGDGQLCVICLKNRRKAAFVPCGHLVCCCNCAKMVELKDEPLCPMCRQDIQYVLRVYES